MPDIVMWSSTWVLFCHLLCRLPNRMNHTASLIIIYQWRSKKAPGMRDLQWIIYVLIFMELLNILNNEISFFAGHTTHQGNTDDPRFYSARCISQNAIKVYTFFYFLFSWIYFHSWNFSMFQITTPNNVTMWRKMVANIHYCFISWFAYNDTFKFAIRTIIRKRVP